MAAKRPHILLITTDGQRGDALSLNGADPLATPNLDFLGASGSNFRHAYAECASCVGARRTIMSGQQPFSHGVVGSYGPLNWRVEHTLPGQLKDAGYQTQLVGRLSLAPPRKRYGFDNLILADTPGEPNDYAEWLHEQSQVPLHAAFAHANSTHGWIGRPSPLNERFTHTTWCVNEALEFMNRRDTDDPSFIWVSFVDPHPPLTPPLIYWERYDELPTPELHVGAWASQVDGSMRGAGPDASIARLTPGDLHRCRAGYYGLINHVDDQVGRLLKVLRERGTLKDTFVMFTSDHGEMLGDHNLFGMSWPYEASIGVPLLARAPEWMECQDNHTDDRVVGLQDVMPTLLDVAGAPAPDRVNGLSLLPLMRGESPAWRPILHGEHAAWHAPNQGNQWVTDGHRKFVWYAQTGVEQFFDIDADPHELHNAIDDAGRTAEVAAWRDRLVQELTDRPEGYVRAARLMRGARVMRPEELRPELNVPIRERP